MLHLDNFKLEGDAYAMEYVSENDAVIEKLLKNYSIKEKDSIKGGLPIE